MNNTVEEKKIDRRSFIKRAAVIFGGIGFSIPLLGSVQGCGMPNDPVDTIYSKDLLAGIKDTYNVGTETYRYKEGHFKKLYINGAEYTGAGGASAFIDLSDVPSDYTGQAGKYPRVKPTEDGLEFGTPVGSGDMEKTTYDPDDDGVIALAQLDPDVCSELEADSKITAHKGDASAHHARYTDGEAVSAMGVKANANPLNHDRYTDLEAIAAAKTIKLDDFTTPDDNTDLNATTSVHGLLPKGTNVGKVLKDDITWTLLSSLITISDASASSYQSTNSTSEVALDSMSVTVTVPSTSAKVILFFYTAASNNTAGKKTFFIFNRDGTDLDYVDTGAGHAANERVPITFFDTDTGQSGSITYSVTWKVDGGTSDVYSRGLLAVIIP